VADRIGVDVGGTFTDLIYYDEATRTTRFAKVPSTPRRPEEGVVRAVHEGVPAEAVAGARWFVHGNTVGLNALLERKGAVVGLLATDGFRDTIEIRRGDRADPYDLFWEPPEPLVPRRLRLSIVERVRADGSVDTPLREDDVRAAAETFVREQVECVAIAFLNAYANPAHERRAAELLREAGYEGALSLSHEISGEYREYERTSTTLVDAYIRPRVSSYLGRLERDLGTAGVRADLLISRSGGGAMGFGEARERPFESIMSGPVGGAQGAAELARRLDLGDLVTADVGGTSFDTCLIVDGRPQLLFEGSVVGLPLQTPWIDVRSIGAGGGSLAWVDAGGLLRVGPGSAGAEPGPACYGRGGTQPTVTDAAFLLGMLGAGELASGLRLDREAAAHAFAALADALSMDEQTAARGVLTIAAASMANAIREITIEQGRDPRELALVPFGGAGPLFGVLLARELGVRRIVVPPYAGNFSAWGLLGTDLTRSAARTRIVRLDEAGAAAASDVLAELFERLAGDGRAGGSGSPGEAVRDAQLDLRYAGQEHTLTIDVRLDGARVAADPGELAAAFAAAYERAFSHTMDEAVEIVSARATVRVPLPPRGQEAPAEHAGRARQAPVAAWSFGSGAWLDFPVLDRAALALGTRLEGPTILVEETATTYVDAGWSIAVDPSGALLLTDDQEVL
jgi:N-methylhydantoinase A